MANKIGVNINKQMFTYRAKEYIINRFNISDGSIFPNRYVTITVF